MMNINYWRIYLRCLTPTHRVRYQVIQFIEHIGRDLDNIFGRCKCYRTQTAYMKIIHFHEANVVGKCDVRS